MIIYVAGKYSGKNWGEKQLNTDRATDAGLKIIKKGHYPLIPHHTHYTDLRANYLGFEIEYEKWLALDNMIIPKCDAFVQISHSNGSDKERVLAEKLGLRIFNSLEDIPDET